MARYPVLSEAELDGKRVLLRAGFDIPMDKGVITDVSRIESMVPTMRFILEHGARLIIMAHQDRPKGKIVPEYSQKPLVPVLEQLLGTTVHFCETCTGPLAQRAVEMLHAGEILLLENLRFDAREEANDPAFAQELAALADVYVDDAFSNAHRAHASMVGVPALLPSFMGVQMEQEVTYLTAVTEHPEHPLTLIISGAKIETKLPVIEAFLERGDDILIGGAIANACIAAQGHTIGTSLVEEEYIAVARSLLDRSNREECANILVPTDALVALSPDAEATVLPVERIGAAQAIYDIGPLTIDRYIETILQSKMIVWNGPLGMHEVAQFSTSSRKIAEAVQRATAGGAVPIVGGGDTIDFHTRYHEDLSHYTFVSTGGGAMLAFVSGQSLPALEALRSGN